MGTYIFDQAWHLERERLRALEDLHDEATFGRLAALGVGAGWRCLEVGGGAGSVARWLADRVGDTGHVLATDLDPRFMEADARANLEVRRHDLLADPLEEGAYDLVHARAVLEHIPAREQALPRLIAATRPGGWVVIEDTFFSGAMVATIVACSVPASEGELLARVFRALATLFAGRGALADYGAQLPGVLAGAGLTKVGAELHARFTWGGAERDFRRLSLEQLRVPLVQFGLLTEDEVTRLLAMTRDGTSGTLPLPMVTAWGQRAAEVA